MSNHASIFSVIATPIGNMSDITLRALETLRSADIVLCEDTRMTKKLLSAHDIHVLTMSYHAHSHMSRIEDIVSMLREGKRIALVSDAGTPGISDPGSELVRMIRKECAANIESGELKIEAIPGPSALIAGLSIAGVPCADFTFLGFLPHKKGRETLFDEIASSERTMIFYESPHRIMKTLDSLVQRELGNGAGNGMKKTVVVCRELTKIFEEVVSGTPTKVREKFLANPDTIRGEFVVIVAPV